MKCKVCGKEFSPKVCYIHESKCKKVEVKKVEVEKVEFKKVEVKKKPYKKEVE